MSDTFFQQLALGSGAGVSDLRPLLAAMRLVKDADEMRRMRMAGEISAKGHVAAMRAAHPGAWEYQLEGAAEGTFRSLGAERLAYPSIVGTGINGDHPALRQEPEPAAGGRAGGDGHGSGVGVSTPQT